MSNAPSSAGKLALARPGLMQLVGQCFCIGLLIEVALVSRHRRLVGRGDLAVREPAGESSVK